MSHFYGLTFVSHASAINKVLMVCTGYVLMKSISKSSPSP